ncbi:GNAT family N-acetyltransferase [Oceanobacillus neutriphilus]|uniref:N-acetyltransferase n=1 Tax=Oceanobacillus neutriphilus TaxID=531815 RepID=A0ABQ2NVP6_9BACI|nr:GNAT family N-acetyltransferase [Oceanobacillus neutriphilus]GGP11711.1 N-acetyltransferase [Oceanobacillus neutriphilus]
MELETERLKVIPCTEETVKIAINQKYDNGPQISAYLKRLNEDSSLLYWGPWLVIRKSDGVVLGDIGFKGKPDEDRAVEAGYGFLESYWGNGYATEAMEALIRWAFKTLKVDRIIAETLVDNYGSIRVLQKLGMKKISSTETMIYWEIG